VQSANDHALVQSTSEILPIVRSVARVRVILLIGKITLWVDWKGSQVQRVLFSDSTGKDLSWRDVVLTLVSPNQITTQVTDFDFFMLQVAITALQVSMVVGPVSSVWLTLPSPSTGLRLAVTR